MRIIACVGFAKKFQRYIFVLTIFYWRFSRLRFSWPLTRRTIKSKSNSLSITIAPLLNVSDLYQFKFGPFLFGRNSNLYLVLDSSDSAQHYLINVTISETFARAYFLMLQHMRKVQSFIIFLCRLVLRPALMLNITSIRYLSVKFLKG